MNKKNKTTIATDELRLNTKKAGKEAKARRQLKIRVGQYEIDTAIPLNSKHCMITDSAKRDYGKQFTGIITDKEAIALTERATGRRYKFSLTPLARTSLLKFDAGEKVSPFEFTLRNPHVRERRPSRKNNNSDRRPPLQGGNQAGSAGTMYGQKSKEKRIQRGMDRFFGKRIFKDELDALRRQLGATVETPAVVT